MAYTMLEVEYVMADNVIPLKIKESSKIKTKEVISVPIIKRKNHQNPSNTSSNDFRDLFLHLV